MNISSKIAALAPITLAAVGLTQLHYLISHFATVAEMAAAVTVGAAVWARAGRKGRQEKEAEPVSSQAAPWSVSGYQVLPPASSVRVPMSEEVRRTVR